LTAGNDLPSLGLDAHGQAQAEKSCSKAHIFAMTTHFLPPQRYQPNRTFEKYSSRAVLGHRRSLSHQITSRRGFAPLKKAKMRTKHNKCIFSKMSSRMSKAIEIRSGGLETIKIREALLGLSA
jgi:hypothetical protein